MSDKKTVIVTKKDFFVRRYGLIVTCPHCKNWKLYFQSFEKRIDKTDICLNCGKKVHVVSEE